MLKENPVLKEELKRILFKYKEVFSDPENVTKEVGQTNLIEFKLKLKEGAEEKLRKYAKPRPVNPALRQNLKRQIEKWLLQRHIAPCDSAFAAPLVPARKAERR